MTIKEQNTYDAIVVGAGMSGGWSAKELAEAGLKTLLLERGPDVTHIKDYPTTMMEPWEFAHRNQLTAEEIAENPIASSCYAFREDAKHFFVKDKEHPYIQEKPFDWIKGYQVGGKSLMWARQVQRWSDYDFEGPARDGFAVDWPIRYRDLAPWYSYVEKFAGVSGNKDGLDTLPDGEFLPAWDLTCVEKHFQESIKKHYGDRHVIYARCAHLTEPQEIHLKQGRGKCMARNLCQRGCPFGGYYTSASSTVPWAIKTGNVTLRPDSVVHSVLYDEDAGQAIGVRVIDHHTKEAIDYYAKVIFLNASTINTNLILLNSQSDRFQNGLGNDSGLLGQYVAFHNYRGEISATYDGDLDKKTTGGRATSAYMPRFRNVKRQEMDFLRGYAVSVSSRRSMSMNQSGIGEQLYANLLKNDSYQPWHINGLMMGETIPKATNYVKLDTEQKDQWGVPLLRINVDYDDNDEQMLQDFHQEMAHMFEQAGYTDINIRDSGRRPGNDIHEMGGVRMGHDPKTSLLNGWNQMHLCKNVYVTDGACMTSTSTQNPSLTYMAIAARAAHHAIDQLKKGELG